MNRQRVVTHTIRQTEILAVLGSGVANTPSVNMLCPQNIASLYMFVET